MAADKVFSMPFAKVYPLLIAKAERKGRTREEVFTVTTWMTGYSAGELEACNHLYCACFCHHSSICDEEGNGIHQGRGRE